MIKLLEATIDSISENVSLTFADNQKLTVSLTALPDNSKVGDKLFVSISPTNFSSDQELSHAIINELLNTSSGSPEISGTN